MAVERAEELRLFCPTEPLAKMMRGDVRSKEDSFKFTMTQLQQRHPSVTKPFQEEFVDVNIKNGFFDAANKMRRQGVLTDVSLVVDQQTFHTHKLILCSCSDYFTSMFNGPLAHHGQQVFISGVSAQSMEAILNYVYTGSIIINEEFIQDILEAACLFLLKNLRERCARFLRDRLDGGNCLQIFSIAKSCSLLTLMEDSLEFISAIFQDISALNDFKQLSFDELIDVLSLEDLAVPSEDYVLEAAFRWLNHDLYGRQQKFVEVLKAIHLPYVSDDMLKQVMENEKSLRTFPELEILFRSALRLTVENWTLSKDSDFNLLQPKSWINPRKCIQCIPSLIAMGGPTLNLFNSELGKWCEITKCKPRHCPGMDVVGSTIYVVGGSLEWKRKRTGEYYNTEKNEWIPMADMHTPRSNFGLVNLEGKLYAIGGYDGNFPLKSAEVYDPRTNQWTQISDMSTARDGACNVSDGESIYVIGGYDGHEYRLTTEVYKPETGVWDISSIPETSVQRQNAMCVYFDSSIYIIGGYHGDTYHSSMEVLDLETNEWSFASPLSAPRHHAGAAAMNGNIYICGGWSAHIPVSHVDVYSIAQDTWRRVSPLPTPTMIRSVAVNFPRKCILNLFANSNSDMAAYRASRIRSLRSISESSSSGNEKTQTEAEAFLTSSTDE
ncbi:kelch-like protein 12 [Clytia hemisphaerica]|uniref:BTB domain-containing protein n=1 Tax=Clytia hemisphaerica TaxID=252671 RepID=A0A7M5WVA4_9CNID